MKRKLLKHNRSKMMGLDSIRFVCAAIVMFSHTGAPWTFLLDWFRPSSEIIRKVADTTINGQAAVIVFFVISGLCINYPFSNGEALNIWKFYTRRFVRIGIPAIITASLLVVATGHVRIWEGTVLWSVLCEAVYYLCYPLFVLASKRLGWFKIFILCFIVALTISIQNAELLHRDAYSYLALGPWACIIGLPCWILGCMLAERRGTFHPCNRRSIWLWRSGALLLSCIAVIIRFHAESFISSNTILLNFYAIFVYFWIGNEVAHAQANPPCQLLEKAGNWSYSLYLIHPLAEPLVLGIGLTSVLSYWSLKNLIVCFVALAASYVFFLSCEKPSHVLAMRLSKKIDGGPKITCENLDDVH